MADEKTSSTDAALLLILNTLRDIEILNKAMVLTLDNIQDTTKKALNVAKSSDEYLKQISAGMQGEHAYSVKVQQLTGAVKH